MGASDGRSWFLILSPDMRASRVVTGKRGAVSALRAGPPPPTEGGRASPQRGASFPSRFAQPPFLCLAYVLGLLELPRVRLLLLCLLHPLRTGSAHSFPRPPLCQQDSRHGKLVPLDPSRDVFGTSAAPSPCSRCRCSNRSDHIDRTIWVYPVNLARRHLRATLTSSRSFP